MTRKLGIWLAVAVAVAACCLWVGRNLYWAETDVPVPPRGEARTNPFYAAMQFTQRLGATAHWDRVFAPLPTRGVLVLSDWHWSISRSVQHALESWVEGGGRLVVDRSIVTDAAFQRWSHIGVRRLADEPAGGRRAPIPGCRRLVAPPAAARVPEAPPSATLCDSETRSYLQVPRDAAWTLVDRLGPQVAHVDIGRGSVTVVNALPFTARRLFDGDHALVLLAATDLRRGDEVRFLSAGESPTLLGLAWSTGSPVILLLAALLAAWLWRASCRFGPAVAPESSARRSLEEQIRGTGEFVRRHGAGQALRAATHRALEETARQHIPGYARLDLEARVAALATASGTAREELAAVFVTTSGRGPRLTDAIQTMERARRRLLTTRRGPR